MRIKAFVNFIKTSNTFIAVLVLLVGLAATLATWQEARDTVDTKTRNTLDQAIDDTDGAIQKRIALYEEVLRGGAGLFTVRPGEIISRQGFNRYASSLHIRERFPGMQGIGFAPFIPKGGLESHQAAIRASGLSGYTVQPVSQSEAYVPALYIEPSEEANQKVIGFDMYTEPARRAAMDTARDTGQPAITDTITLVQNFDNDNDIGFIYYMPIYKGPAGTVENRRANILGFILVPIRMQTLTEGIFDQEALPLVNMKVYDSTAKSPENLLYDSPNHEAGLTVSQPVRLGDQTWLIEAAGSSGILSTQERQQPFMILLLGTGASLLLAAFIFIVMRSRSRELAFQKQLDVQNAKDELLSLASHQLRTPATGVKQYIGIVLEGYTGEVTKEQRQMLQKANASNERQLEIVNQLLHVTRLETGRLMLRFSPFDLTNLLEDIINEQHDTIASRGQHLEFKKPKEPVTLHGDEQYLRMAIENLLSNASKYTHNGGTVKIDLAEAPDRVTLSVSDTGVGISPEDYAKLFQKFSRIDNELSVQAGGSGIGLYLTKEIIELHGGTISVDSERDQGSTFTLSLPKRNK